MRWFIGPLTWRDNPVQEPEIKADKLRDLPAKFAWQGVGDGLLDFRPLPEQAAPGRDAGDMGGACLHAVSDDDAEISSEWEPVGEGDWQEIKADQRLRDLFPKRPGFSPTGTTLRELAWEALTAGSTPDGSDFARPLMPGIDRRLRLNFAGLGYDEPFLWGDVYTSNVRDVIRADFAETLDRQQQGEVSDPKLAEMTLDYLQQKFGVSNWQEFVPEQLRGEIEGPSPHKTILPDNFNRPDGALGTASGGFTWNNIASGWSIVSNRAEAGTSNCVARAEFDLSSVDHYCQGDVGGQGYRGPIGRVNSVGTTYYWAAGSPTATRILSKLVAGTQTNYRLLGGSTGAVTLRLGLSGSTQTYLENGVSQGSGSDTAISSGLRTGMRIGSLNATHQTFDNFESSDGILSSFNPAWARGSNVILQPGVA